MTLLSLMMTLMMVINVAKCDEFSSKVDFGDSNAGPVFNCHGSKDCSKYSYCRSSIGGSECASNYGPTRSGGGFCGQPSSSGSTTADHNLCLDYERSVTGDNRRATLGRPSVYRCYEELGYKCANAYYMPCRRGRNECPIGFSCKSETFMNNETADICLPDSEGGNRGPCQSVVDCGFYNLLDYWQDCDEQRKECNIVLS